MADYVLHEEHFDCFTAMINGESKSCRLTIWKVFTKKQMKELRTTVPSVIIFQADANGFLAVKKLENLIGDFRYDLIDQEYIDLRKFGK